MIIKNEGWNLVLLGKWNKYILSPEWSAKNIFGVDKVQVEFAINLDQPPRFTSGNVRMIPGEDSVVFVPVECVEASLVEMEKCAQKLLETLPYTPVYACGINFGFTEKIDMLPASVTRLFDIEDTELLSGHGEIQESSIRRTIQLDKKKLMFMIAQNEDEVLFDFNFHYDVKDGNSARELLAGEVVENRKYSLDILAKYELTLEEGD